MNGIAGEKSVSTKKQGIIICCGDGTLWVDPKNGDLEWAEVSTPMETWCRQNGYVDALRILGELNLDTHEVPLPNCTGCDSYVGCTDEGGEPDPTYCSAVDGDAIASSILSALASLDEEEKNEVFGFSDSDEW